ncbi:finger putative transcription factor family-related [Holotrichia oblita]|uniref:Finger putative transcription factor family-related n=2 Tax=Holotrichia oblita TaxID=644536 RepID=A0ACB9TXI7_HOLOL|nr:finger putative transcription factor family-related [Holotrichia oblita]KAI4471607.1 finger putative transcription factor family-related [Holotrichia oblita]
MPEDQTRLDLDNVAYNYILNKSTGLYSCKTCDHESENKEEIEKHVLTHEEKFECETCKEIFYNAYKYSLHVKKHDETSTKFKCPLCSYTTSRRTSIAQHINMIHLQKYLYYCQFCGKGFSDALMYREHENIHMGAGPLSCVVCQKTFSFTRNLVQHQVRFHKASILGIEVKNQCGICKRSYSKASTLENHMKVHDRNIPKPKIHLCDTCGKGFAQKNKLILHNRVHTGYKPYKCGYCVKSFTKKEYLVMHERVHSGEKPYCCIYCGKCFNQDASLRVHMRTHTGEKPYVCHLCSKGFVSSASLKIHLSKCAG